MRVRPRAPPLPPGLTGRLPAARAAAVRVSASAAAGRLPKRGWIGEEGTTARLACRPSAAHPALTAQPGSGGHHRQKMPISSPAIAPAAPRIGPRPRRETRPPIRDSGRRPTLSPSVAAALPRTALPASVRVRKCPFGGSGGRGPGRGPLCSLFPIAAGSCERRWPGKGRAAPA
jgi:hypothetical protein